MRRSRQPIGRILGTVLALSCGGETRETGDPAIAQGEKIYRNVCAVCHSADPNQGGQLGPAIADASRELLEAKLIRGEYPAGYTPRRGTNQMPRFEYLESNIDDIAAFLASRRD